MSRPRKTKRTLPSGDLSDPQTLASMCRAYLEHLAVKNYAQTTIEYSEGYLHQFILWCAERAVTQGCEVTKPIIDRYQRHLFYYRQPNGKPLSFRSQNLTLSVIRSFFRWLVRHNFILYNPASEINLPRIQRGLPKHTLTANEADRVMNLPDITTPLGIRDRAMLEILYSTGIRRAELTRLTIYSIDFERGVMSIRLGKGQKDRFVPIGERAMAWTTRYLNEVRPSLTMPPDDSTLFLTYTGQPFTPDVLSHVIKQYVSDAQLGKTGACHIFRHSVATLMLEGGADIRVVQEMLGHQNIATTQIYTRVSIKHLKAIHTATHPSSKLERSTGGSPTLDLDDTDEN